MSKATKTILIVDDEAPIREMLRMALEVAGYQCLEAGDVQQAHASVVDQQPDLILLDWMLPGSSGLELIRRLKRSESTAQLPVILLTAKAEEDNKIRGLDVGADDYITKPFAMRELLSRIKAVLRRGGHDEAQQAVITVDGLVVDCHSQRVLVDQQPVALGPTEFRLLHFLITHQDRVYSRSQLLDHVWSDNIDIEERTVDVHIRRLRKHLRTEQIDYSQLIQTVHGVGYRFSKTAE